MAIESQEKHIEQMIQALRDIRRIPNIEKQKYWIKINGIVGKKHNQFKQQMIKDLFIQSEKRETMKSDFRI